MTNVAWQISPNNHLHHARNSGLRQWPGAGIRPRSDCAGEEKTIAWDRTPVLSREDNTGLLTHHRSNALLDQDLQIELLAVAQDLGADASAGPQPAGGEEAILDTVGPAAVEGQQAVARLESAGGSAAVFEYFGDVDACLVAVGLLVHAQPKQPARRQDAPLF